MFFFWLNLVFFLLFEQKAEVFTDYDFPVFQRVRDFVRASYLGEAHSANDKDNYARNVFDGLLAFVFVPVSVPRTVNTYIYIDGFKEL